MPLCHCQIQLSPFSCTCIARVLLFAYCLPAALLVVRGEVGRGEASKRRDRGKDVGDGGWVRGHRPGRGADSKAGEAEGGRAPKAWGEEEERFRRRPIRPSPIRLRNLRGIICSNYSLQLSLLCLGTSPSFFLICGLGFCLLDFTFGTFSPV